MKYLLPIALAVCLLASAFVAGYYAGTRPVISVATHEDAILIGQLEDELVASKDTLAALTINLEHQRQRIESDSLRTSQVRAEARRHYQQAQEPPPPFQGSDSTLASQASHVARSRLLVDADAISPLPVQGQIQFALPRAVVEDYLAMATVTVPRYQRALEAYESALKGDSLLIASMALESALLRRSLQEYDVAVKIHERKDEAEERLMDSLQRAYRRERLQKRVLGGASLGITTLLIIHLVR